MFGFTEPYLFDKPIQTGFTAYYRTFKFNQAQQAGISSTRGGDGVHCVSEFAAELFAVEHGALRSRARYAVRRSFKRFGLTYSWDTSNITTYLAGIQGLFLRVLAFRNVVAARTPCREL